MLNEKNSSSKVGTKVKGWTTEEKAQYEVYKNGDLSRATIADWIRNDLQSIASFIHGTLTDETIFNATVDAYYARYKKLHVENGTEVKNES